VVCFARVHHHKSTSDPARALQRLQRSGAPCADCAITCCARRAPDRAPEEGASSRRTRLPRSYRRVWRQRSRPWRDGGNSHSSPAKETSGRTVACAVAFIAPPWRPGHEGSRPTLVSTRALAAASRCMSNKTPLADSTLRSGFRDQAPDIGIGSEDGPLDRSPQAPSSACRLAM